MTTKGQLVEQVQLILNGGANSTRSRYSAAAVSKTLGSVLSDMLKAQMLDTVYNTDGESIPDGAMIATYENIPVSGRDRGSCRFKLPAMPLQIPERMGLFSVYPSGYPEREFIPIPSGLINILNRDRLLSPLGRKCYSWDSGTVTIHSDAVGAGVNTVDMKLCILDIDKYSDNDMLPIPSDMEYMAIAKVLQMYGVTPPTDRADNKKPSPDKTELR